MQKVFGPGNAYVVEAKRQVFGHVAIDLLPGPSEILVIADDSANSEWIAADLLAQSEHGQGSIAILLTTSPRLLDGVADSPWTGNSAFPRVQRNSALALKNASLVLVGDLETAVTLANQFSAEHVAIAATRPGEIALRLTTSGAIFLGGISPVVGGDFLAGPSHEFLPEERRRAFQDLPRTSFSAEPVSSCSMNPRCALRCQ